VEERLPEPGDGDWVIGIATGSPGNAAYTYEEAPVMVEYDPYEQRWYLADIVDAEVTVTYWMPIPDGPAEGARR
jgi:hypothetical protein